MPNRKIQAGVTPDIFKSKYAAFIKSHANALGSSVSDIQQYSNNFTDISYMVFSCCDFFQTMKDLQKIQFDFENLDIGRPDGSDNCSVESAAFEDIGGTNVLWVTAGGDWECPIAFVLYFDDKDALRAYIPEDGNVYCHHCKAAYGNDNCDKCTFDDITKADIQRICQECNCICKGTEESIEDINCNDTALSNDVRARLEIVDASGNVTIPAQLPVAASTPAQATAQTQASSQVANPAPAPAPVAATKITSDQLAAALIISDALDKDLMNKLTDTIGAIAGQMNFYIPPVKDILNDDSVVKVVKKILDTYPWH